MKLQFNTFVYYLHRDSFKSFTQLWFHFAFFLLLLIPGESRSQQLPCYFDEHQDYLMQNDPEFEEKMLMNERMIQDMMENNPQAIMNSEVYTIPVVFHVIHHSGESIGVGSNISSTLIYQALQDLNDDFRDIQNLGNDVEIEFCLAVRNPEGGSTNGINRVNGDGIFNYQNAGMSIGNNEGDLKSLS